MQTSTFSDSLVHLEDTVRRARLLTDRKKREQQLAIGEFNSEDELLLTALRTLEVE